MLCPGSWQGSVLAQGREHCAPRKRCYQSRPYGGVSAECARKRRAAANTTRDVQVPQREHPAIAMRLQVDFHSGSATAALRSEGTAGVGKVRLARPPTEVPPACRSGAVTGDPRGPLTAGRRFPLHPQVTLATQCDSEEFARRLPELARAWQGPMVVAVLLRTWGEAQDVSRALRDSPVLSKCDTAARLTPFAPSPHRTHSEDCSANMRSRHLSAGATHVRQLSHITRVSLSGGQVGGRAPADFRGGQG